MAEIDLPEQFATAPERTSPPTRRQTRGGRNQMARRYHGDLSGKIPPFYVITGGPGSGKTTLLGELARRGNICVPEDARAAIQEQVAKGSRAVPWADAPLFAELLMQRSITTYRDKFAQHPQTPIYFDRGVGDAFTCADLIGHTLPADLREQALQCRYREPVFVAPWWPEIYTTDEERHQSREEAERTEHAVIKTYTMLGYRIVRLPLVSASERADFILRQTAP